MLQQTQVATVIPYYLRFLELFPTVEGLARAPEQTVLAAWSGLGYYSRAKNLKKGARYLLDHHTGEFPRDREALLEVPGIGPYTAGAILSIAFDKKEPLVDGNVQRVFARFFAVEKSLALREVQRFFWEKAREWVECSSSARILNQGLMELGATVCVKGTPHCPRCPLRKGCSARKEGKQQSLPLKKERPKPVELWWVGLVLESEGKVYLRKNAKGEWWSDLWDFPRVEVEGRKKLTERPLDFIKGVGPVKSWEGLPHQKHTVTHHRIHVAPYLVRLSRPHKTGKDEGEWFTREELAKIPVSPSCVKSCTRICKALC